MGDLEYRLSSTLTGHTSDVRAVAVTADGDIITASRDQTTRRWIKIQGKNGNEYLEKTTYIGHTGFVMAVCIVPKSEKNPDVLVITGSRDTSIKVFPHASGDPIHSLSGHSDAVSCLAWNDCEQVLASGSWDHSCRIWQNWEIQTTIKGHTGPVWAVAFISGKLLSASADKTIKLWNKEQNLVTFRGHEDCVRGLVVLDAEKFLSCSNDATVKLWNISGTCLGSYSGHTSFIYTIGETGSQLMTGGEDRTLRVWDSDGVNIQTIHFPTQSIWCVAALPNGDIVAGSSDGVCRVFTRNPERLASEEQQKEFAESVAKSTVAMDLGGVKKSDLPGKESLNTPGKKDGQTKMVKEGDKVFCYSWSASKFQWDPVGEVVGGAGGSAGTSGKVLYQGKEYDYVFDVDLDGERSLKLPYNSSEDPWYVAQAFIHTHDLPQTYLDTVAQFIITNANVSSGPSGGTGYQDPFTGGNRYIPGSGSSTGGAMSDPFTGSGRYVPGSSNAGGGAGGTDPFTGAGRYVPNANSAKSNFFPQSTTLKFEACNAEGILNKFREFNSKLDNKISEGQIQDIVKTAVENESDPSLLGPLEIALQWPPESVWPALDVLRLALRSNKVHKTWIQEKKGESIVNLLVSLLKPQNPAPTQLLALRCLANLSAHPPGNNMLSKNRDLVVKSTVTITPYPNKNVEIAASTVLLNYSVLLPTNCDANQLLEVLSAISTLAITAKDPEAQFRTLVALGTLLKKSNDEGRGLVKNLDLQPIIKNLAGVYDPPKVGECARDVLNLL